jgi:hypothetical protein
MRMQHGARSRQAFVARRSGASTRAACGSPQATLRSGLMHTCSNVAATPAGNVGKGGNYWAGLRGIGDLRAHVGKGGYYWEGLREIGNLRARLGKRGNYWAGLRENGSLHVQWRRARPRRRARPPQRPRPLTFPDAMWSGSRPSRGRTSRWRHRARSSGNRCRRPRAVISEHARAFGAARQ